jgi:hypothetical protein
MGIFRRSKDDEQTLAGAVKTPSANAGTKTGSPSAIDVRDRPAAELGLAVKKLREGGNLHRGVEDAAVYPAEPTEVAEVVDVVPENQSGLF